MELYNLGEYEYRKDRLIMRLSGTEQSFIESNPVVRFAAEHDNYPISFYNNHAGEFQGIFHDVLKEM